MPSSFRNKWQNLGHAFPFLLLCDFLAVLSLTTGSVAISWWIVTHGGAADLSIFGITAALTMLIALPLLSAQGDRLAKSRVMAWGLLTAVITALGLAIMASFGFYHIWLIILIYAFDVIAFSMVLPAVSSIAADLVNPNHLAEALSLQKSAQSLGRLAGPVTGGAIIALSSIPAALWVYTVILLIAALSAFAIPVIRPAPALNKSHWRAEVRAGLHAKWHIPIDRNWTLFSFFIMLFFSPAIGMLLPLKIHFLNLGAQWLGATEAALGLGMLTGALWGAAKVIQWLGRFSAARSATFTLALGICATAFSDKGWMLVLCFGLIGFALSVSQLVGQTHRQLAVPDHFRARFSSVNFMVMTLSGILGPAMAGIALGLLDINMVYAAFGMGLFLVTLTFSRIPDIRTFLALDHHEVKNWYATLQPKLFL
ncbi:MFS transporter [Iodobacter fluviatilis]|uniref:Enterobactin exporter EntS n=1 Tax=Iodobacter fluviatilis TaxID=537 RepID=A0A377Q7P2_9NEIS|nr:MFS transporter [Iodobacter fluviatilis]TCU88653.1 putative MFS family arabinose efflux permease [Iodobacter fluviatilis]STQ91276.1 enterobactin exporter EntS [Iodobacter fluviatilis]